MFTVNDYGDTLLNFAVDKITMLPIPNDFLLAITAVAFGVLGAVTRILIQYKRDGQLPTTGFDLYVEYFLGGAAGFMLWLSELFHEWKPMAVAAFGIGGVAVDYLENFFAEKH